MNLQEEQNLIKVCQDGDLSAFSEIYDLYLEKIYRFVYYRVSHKETAEDLTSQTFLKALKGINSADFSDKNFSAWIYKIAYNLIIDCYRSNKKDLSIENIFNLSSDLDIVGDADKNKKLDAIKNAMKVLSFKQKEILVMRVWDELSYKEISEINGDSEGTCKVTFSRALNKIKDHLPVDYFVLLIILNILKN